MPPAEFAIKKTEVAEKILGEATEEKAKEKTEKSVSNNKKLLKGGRLRWTAAEKKKVLQYFKKHVEKNLAPKKDEVLKFIEKYPTFKSNDWVRIKTLVYNTYRDKK